MNTFVTLINTDPQITFFVFFALGSILFFIVHAIRSRKNFATNYKNKFVQALYKNKWFGTSDKCFLIVFFLALISQYFFLHIWSKSFEKEVLSDLQHHFGQLSNFVNEVETHCPNTEFKDLRDLLQKSFKGMQYEVNGQIENTTPVDPYPSRYLNLLSFQDNTLLSQKPDLYISIQILRATRLNILYFLSMGSGVILAGFISFFYDRFQLTEDPQC